MQAQCTDLPVLSYQEKLALHLHNLGMNDAKIAREMGIHRGTVSRILTRAAGKVAHLHHLAAEAGLADPPALRRAAPPQ